MLYRLGQCDWHTCKCSPCLAAASAAQRGRLPAPAPAAATGLQFDTPLTTYATSSSVICSRCGGTLAKRCRRLRDAKSTRIQSNVRVPRCRCVAQMPCSGRHQHSCLASYVLQLHALLCDRDGAPPCDSVNATPTTCTVRTWRNRSDNWSSKAYESSKSLQILLLVAAPSA